MDSTIISAPSSTKNKEKKRDPDAHQVKKGNTWHFGYKAHIGVDRDSGLVHTVEATAANVHDATETSKLLTGDEKGSLWCVVLAPVFHQRCQLRLQIPEEPGDMQAVGQRVIDEQRPVSRRWQVPRKKR